jgi:hypothetical protein
MPQNNPYKFMGSTSEAHKRNVPHAVVVGHLQQDPRDSERYVPLVSFQTFESSLVNIRPDDSGIYNNSCAVSLEGLFMPFSCNSGNLKAGSLPNWQSPNPLLIGPRYAGTGIFVPGVVTNNSINPYMSGGTTEWITYNNSYSGIHQRKMQNPSLDDARAVSFRAPMVMTGFGFDIAGFPTPNAKVSGLLHQSSGEFAPNYYKDPRLWKSGPVDLRYDQLRGVWMSPGAVIRGTLDARIPAYPAGMVSGVLMTLNFRDDAGVNHESAHKLRVFNWTDSALNANTRAVCSYSVYDGLWIITSVNCP